MSVNSLGLYINTHSVHLLVIVLKDTLNLPLKLGSQLKLGLRKGISCRSHIKCRIISGFLEIINKMATEFSTAG